MKAGIWNGKGQGKERKGIGREGKGIKGFVIIQGREGTPRVLFLFLFVFFKSFHSSRQIMIYRTTTLHRYGTEWM